MKNIFKNLTFSNLISILQNLLRRFPVSFVFIILTAVTFFVAITLDDFNQDWYAKVILTGILSFFLSTGISMHANAHLNDSKKKLSLQLITIAFAVLYYVYVDKISDYIYAHVTLSLLFGFIGFIFSGAYSKGVVKKDEAKNLHYYPYFETVFYAFILSVAMGLVLNMLGGLAYVSIGELFDLYSSSIFGKLIGYWLVITNVIIAPIFGLYKLPIEFLNDDDYNEENEVGFLSSTPSGIIKYIFLPAVIVYFIILYAYSVKLMINFGDWPKGQVSWFVIIFCIVGYFTYIFSYPLESKNSLVQKFRTYFPIIAVPQILILFYAIYLRINSYGLTTNRYLVVLFGLWLLGVSIYFIFSKNKKLIYVPATIAILSLIVSVGPWSIYNLPISSQMNKLEALLTEENIMSDDGTLDFENPQITKDNQFNIRSTISYICGIDDCKTMSELFQIDLEELKKDLIENNKYIALNDIEDYQLSQWDIQNAIFKKLGIENISKMNGEEIIDFYNEKLNIIPIDGYSTLQEFNVGNFETSNDNDQSFWIGDTEYTTNLTGEEIEKIINKDIPTFDITDDTTIIIRYIRYNKTTNTLESLDGYILKK